MSDDWEWKLTIEEAEKYSPDQPREPAGGPGGGRWTSGSSGGAVGNMPSFETINRQLHSLSSASTPRDISRFFKLRNVPLVGRSKVTDADVYQVSDGYGEFGMSFDAAMRREYGLTKIGEADIIFD